MPSLLSHSLESCQSEACVDPDETLLTGLCWRAGPAASARLPQTNPKPTPPLPLRCTGHWGEEPPAPNPCWRGAPAAESSRSVRCSSAAPRTLRASGGTAGPQSVLLSPPPYKAHARDHHKSTTSPW